MKLSVLMPVYNESRTLRTIVSRVLASPIGMDLELICVDDGSTDGSRDILAEFARTDARVRYIPHEKNQGKAGAIHTAIGHMTGDIAIIQDSDLEYDPSEFPQVLAPILQGHADAVFGSRFASRGQRRVMYFWHTLTNQFLTLVTNVLNDINVTDMETGYKAIRTEFLKDMELHGERFGIEPEITTRLVQSGARIYEVPISYYGRTYAEGKRIGWKDGVAALWYIFKFRFLDTRFTRNDAYYRLQTLRRARGFNRWFIEKVRPFVGPRVFEAGSGVGSFTELLLDRKRLVCADRDPFLVGMVKRRFAHLENIRVVELDLEDPGPETPVGGEKFDTVMCLNVLQHAADDSMMLRRARTLLEPGGHVIVVAPADPALFTACDAALGHRRRYSVDELKQKLGSAGFEVVQVEQVNRLGAIGWRINGMLGRTAISSWQVRLFELLLPLAKLLDSMRLGRGLSVIGVGKNPG